MYHTMTQTGDEVSTINQSACFHFAPLLSSPCRPIFHLPTPLQAGSALPLLYLPWVGGG